MYINGSDYKQMMISAANSLDNQKSRINELNVFPVPDGDTGTNMSMTMNPICENAGSLSNRLDTCSKEIASIMLRSARGNSGVILSLFFRGIAKGFEGLDSAGPEIIVSALKKGVEEAYKAIQNPTEGTILTVMRESTEQAANVGCVQDLFEKMESAAKASLKNTPNLLPVLKQANVVDAGGSGFVSILEGINAALRNEPVELENVKSKTGANFAQFDEGDIEYPYCTECIVDKSSKYIGEDKASAFRDFVMSAGNSAVFVDDTDIIKVHVHTKDPGAVISKALEYGTLHSVKIENMRLQHSDLVGGIKDASKQQKATRAPSEKKYGFVTVTMGEGIKNTFAGLGADAFVYGGQTMNPSTEQILDAVYQTPSDIVYILPNNSNICMVAGQAAELCEGKVAVVIPSKSVPQGIAAMLAFDPTLEAIENTANMAEAMSNVKTLEMTYAAHDSVIDGNEIKKGQYLGLVDHKIKHVSSSRKEAMECLSEHMSDASFITVFHGSDVDKKEADEMLELLSQKLGDDIEITMLDGGQPLYYYVISAE